MTLSKIVIAATGIFVAASFSCLTAASQDRCDSYDSLRTYLETAHKMHETARAMQVLPDRRGDVSIRIYRNHDTGVWAVMRVEPPNCAWVVVTGYGWEDASGTAL